MFVYSQMFLKIFFRTIYMQSESLYVVILYANLKSTDVVLITKILFYILGNYIFT